MTLPERPSPAPAEDRLKRPPAARVRHPLLAAAGDLPALLPAAVTPFLPAWWGAAALALLLAFWLARRPARREAAAVGISLGLAIGALAWDAVSARPFSAARWRSVAARGYAGLWQELATAAERGADRLSPATGNQASLAAFRELDRLIREHPLRVGAGLTLVLLQPDGDPAAWAGEGLLHELPRDPGRAAGAAATFRAGFSAVSLFAARPLATDPAWTLVAGQSLDAGRLPFAPPGGQPRDRYRWSLVERDHPIGPIERIAPGALAVPLAGAPTLIVQGAAGDARPTLARWPRRLAWGLLAAGLLVLSAMRLTSTALVLPAVVPRRRRAVSVAGLLLAGLGCAALAAGARPGATLALLVGAGLASAGLARARRAGGRQFPGFQGAAAALGLWAGAGAIQLWLGPIDLGASLGASPGVLALRLALFGVALGLVARLGRRQAPVDDRHEAWAWGAVLLALAAGALHDFSWAAPILLAAAGAAAGRWAGSCDLPRRPASLALVALLAALLAAAGWGSAYRSILRRHLEVEVLPALAPPTPAERAALAAELDAFFARFGLDALVPRDPAGLESQDLAFALWRHSPLAREGTLSALVARLEQAPPASFAFGLPVARQEGADPVPGRWQELELPGWETAWLSGQAPLTYRGRPLGTAPYWLLLRPGFRLGEPRPDLAVGLLRGGPAVSRPAAELLDPASYALYTPAGRAIVTPWRESPPLNPVLVGGGEARVSTPQGPAWAFARRGADGVEVLYLSALGPIRALERVGTHAASDLLMLALAVVAALLLALPRAAFRDVLRRTVRSYSKRLLLVLTLLLLVPLLLLNLVLVRGLERRLEREQRIAGEAALDSAQRVLGEYILALEPGFGLDTALDDELLIWLSRVVHHELNLYWGSRLYASSKPELFAAGLLPTRIPGEVYSRLSLLSYDLASRVNRAVGAVYLELYAPLRIPGVPQQERLFLSMPLLAQQEEVAEEVASLRRQTFLLTAGLFLLLTAVGTRLARNFTRPLNELVRGTQRIAAGAVSLDLKPSELELAALVEAIDHMAGSIAEGRERLLHEKQVVEQMVENVTAGVVSLDRQRRVLLRNRIAAELLGVRVGERLDAAVARDERLGPVAAFLAGEPDRAEQRTVRLEDPAGEQREWSLVWVPLPGIGEPTALLVVEDVTEVLRGQRLAAWAEMARIIAHEIKNPLTPIRLSAEHLVQVRDSDPEHFDAVFDRCTANILRQVDELQEIAGEFSTYSRIPRIERREGDLAAAVETVVEAYRVAPPPGWTVAFAAPAGGLPARFDAKLVGRAVRNLLENAIRAGGEGGSIEVRVAGDGENARIVVADRGPGVAPEVLPLIFDPYFSTHAAGTGLGLPIARRIAEEHGGSLTARNRPEGGLEAVITLPLS